MGDQKPHCNRSLPAAAGSSKSNCYRCGRGHLSSECPCKGYVCHSCKKKGQLSKMCRKKGKGNKPKDEQAKVLTDKDDNPMHHVESGSNKPYKAVINVNGNSLAKEIDTGASVSVIGKEKSIKEVMLTVELQKTSVNLKTYTGQSIAVLGSALVPVEYNGQTLNLYPSRWTASAWMRLVCCSPP